MISPLVDTACLMVCGAWGAALFGKQFHASIASFLALLLFIIAWVAA